MGFRTSRIGVGLLLSLALSSACAHSSATPPTDQGPLLPTSPTALPEFDTARFNALMAQLASEGMPVVVNIWASWCGPCTIEAPRLAKVSADYSGRVQFLGVDIMDNVIPARAFIQKYQWTYPSIFDPPAAIRNSMGLTGQPLTLIFDGTGKRVFVQLGAIPADVLIAQLNKVLAT